jgi:hypothetical protein
MRMLIANQIVEVKWSNNNKLHYEGKNYTFTAMGDSFLVKIEDLTFGNTSKVKIECDFCDRDFEKEFHRYQKKVNESELENVNHYDNCSKCIKSKKDKLKSEAIDLKNYTLKFPIKEINPNHKRKRWDKSDTEKLVELYESEPWEAILEELPFKKCTITKKAMELGLSRKNPYSKEEIEILETHYLNSTFEELKVLLPNRTECSIQSKANNLGIKKREYWSEEDISKLKEFYPILPNLQLTDMFKGRTESSLMSMAEILNLSKSSEAFEYYRENVKQEISEQLLTFALELGRTPTQEEITANPNMAGMISYHRYFGSYSNACSELGLDPNTQIFGRSYILKSINGDTCLSSKEKVITDLLIINNILFKKEEMYKNILPYGATEKQIRCDWYIDGIIVEYFGMAEREDYKARMNEKISLCELYNIPLVQLYPHDIKNNCFGLIKKFEEVGLIINMSVAV